MGRAKKKLPVAPSKDHKVGAVGDANPNAVPVQRKRGRPRKIQITEEVAAADSDSKGDENNGTDKKYPKLSADSSGRKRSMRAGKKETDASPTSDSDKVLESSNTGSHSHVEEVSKVKVSRKPGRRRKSEPHRAAGTLFEGT